ncbi:MAG: hypothetical protein KDD68_18000 [Bdellovibrionales bacterium]|nr:hypothetical protein [Bdellovibrionales bacterium]
MIGAVLTLAIGVGTGGPVPVDATVEQAVSEERPVSALVSGSKVFDEVTFEKGAFVFSVDGKFSSSRGVRRKPGTKLGWAMIVRTNQPTLVLREVLFMSRKDYTKAFFDRSGTSEWVEMSDLTVPFKVEDGLVYGRWPLLRAHPPGEYKIQLFYQEILILEAVYVVE